MNIEKAKSVVINYFPDAEDPLLEELLTVSQGTKPNSEKYFRPYWVAAHLILTHYRKLTRADEVSFAYDKSQEIAQNLLRMQSGLDNGNDVPDAFGTDDLITDNFAMGVSVY